MEYYSPNEVAALEYCRKAQDPKEDFDVEKFLNLYKSIILNPGTFRREPIELMKGTIEDLIYTREKKAENSGIIKGKEQSKEEIISKLFS